MAFSACFWSHLFFGFLRAAFPGARIDRPGRRHAGGSISRTCATVAASGAALVRANASVVLLEQRDADGHLLGGPHRVDRGILQPLAEAQLFRLFHLLPVFRDRGQRFLELSVGRHVAGGRVSRTIFQSGRSKAGIGRGKPAFTREPLSAAVGVVPNLFRVGNREATQS